MAITVFIFAPVAGALSARFGPKWIVTTGMALEAIALFSIAAVTSTTTPIYDFYPILVVYGAGVGLAISQLTAVVLGSVPWQKAGIGSGANNTVRQVGSAFGIAVIGAVLVAIIASVGQADVAASSLPVALKTYLNTVLNAGLSGGVGEGVPAAFANSPFVDAVKGVFADAITQGTRWAAFTAGIFVSFGALSSILIPNPHGKTLAKTQKTTPIRPVAGLSGMVSTIVIVQFLAIIGLLAAFSWNYQQNSYMETWYNNNAAPIAFLLNYYILPIIIGIVGLVFIVWQLILRRDRASMQSKKVD
jgi:MFS family permease